jgi:hypothetical protein
MGILPIELLPRHQIIILTHKATKEKGGVRMPKITIGEQMVNAFVELGEDIDAIVDEINHSLDAKAFPTNNSINEAQRCITALGIVNAGIIFLLDSLERLDREFEGCEDAKPLF